MPARRRKSDDVHTTYCDVELSRQLSAEVASGVAQEICKHIIFMRNQIPMLYEELRSSAVVRLLHATLCCTLDWHILPSVRWIRPELILHVQDASSAATTARRSGKQRKSDKVCGTSAYYAVDHGCRAHVPHEPIYCMQPLAPLFLACVLPCS